MESLRGLILGNFGHVHKVAKEVGGKHCTFRSKFEYRWAVWCQFRKEQGLIKNWWYELPESRLELEQQYKQNKKMYQPDFTIQTNMDEYEYEETKGYFPAKDFTKIKLASEQYENPITLIFASTAKNPKSASIRAQIRRAERLEPHIKRIIWNANKDIFQQIKFLFDE